MFSILLNLLPSGLLFLVLAVEINVEIFPVIRVALGVSILTFFIGYLIVLSFRLRDIGLPVVQAFGVVGLGIAGILLSLLSTTFGTAVHLGFAGANLWILFEPGKPMRLSEQVLLQR